MSPEPSTTAQRSLRAWLRAQLAMDLKDLVSVLAALAGAAFLLGTWSQRAREALLKLPPLSYPKDDLAFTGLESLSALFWNGIVTPFSSYSALRFYALGLVVLGLVCLFLAPVLERYWRGARFALLLVVALVLTHSGSLYTAALRATHPDDKLASSALCTNQLGPSWSERVAYESCSWLSNDSQRNDERRQSLAGLLGFLLFACLAALWTAWRWQSASRWERWGRRVLLIYLGLLLAIFGLRQIPLAHAYARWGLKYPAVGLAGSCESTLREAVAAGSCCVFDVSAGATSTALLLRGDGCPGGMGVVLWGSSEDDKQCRLVKRPTRVVTQGCG